LRQEGTKIVKSKISPKKLAMDKRFSLFGRSAEKSFIYTPGYFVVALPQRQQ
jgi:hypothetical protein